MSIYIVKHGNKRKLNISATDVQLLDIDGRFKNKNLEDALKEVGSGTEGNIQRIEQKVTNLEVDKSNILNTIGDVNVETDGDVSSQLKDCAKKDGTLQTNLNAEMVGGFKPNSFAVSNHNHNIINGNNGCTLKLSSTETNDCVGTSKTNNVDIASWNGISFSNSCPDNGIQGKPSASIDVRSGNMFLDGDIYLKGQSTGLFQSVSNGKSAIANAITGKGIEANINDTFQVLSNKINQISTGTNTNDANANANQILNGATAYVKNNKITGNIPILTGVRNTTGVNKWGDNGLAVYPERGYQKGGSGDGEIKVPAQSIINLYGITPDKIVAGNNICGINGIAKTLNTNYQLPTWFLEGQQCPLSNSKTGTLYNNEIFFVFDNANEIYAFNIDKNSWRYVTNIPTQRYAPIIEHYNGKIYVIAGGYNVSINEIYDIKNNSWSTGASIPIGCDHSSSIIYNGKIYCFGGQTGGGKSNYINKVQIYNISSNSWAYGADMSDIVASMGTVLYNGRVYCFGGESRHVSINKVQIYDIGNNSWSTGANMPSSRFGLYSVLYKGKVYCFGGDSDCSNKNEIYNISSNSWYKGCNFPEGGYRIYAVLYNDFIYCIAKKAFVYNPE